MRQLKRKCRRNRILLNARIKSRCGKPCRVEVRPRRAGFAQSIVSVLGVAALIGMGTLARAEQTDDESPLLPEVVVPGKQEKEKNAYKPEAPSSQKYTEPLRDIPQTVTVVPKAVIEEQGATTLRDVLRGVSGITFQAGEGGVPAGDNLTVRGFSARTDLFVDSVRDFGGYSRDPFNVEQVEVAKGPASSYAGRGSSGGTVNLVSKRPTLDPFYQGAIGGGTDAYRRVTLDLNQPVTGFGMTGTALRLNAMWHNADVPGRDVVKNERWGIAPSLAFGLGTPTRVTLGYFHLSQDNLPDLGLPWVPAGNNNPVLSSFANQAPPVNFGNFYGLKNRDFEKTITDLGTVEVAHDFNDSVRFRNLLRYGQTRRDSFIVAPRFKDLDPGPQTVTGTVIERGQRSRDQLDTILADQADLLLRFKTGRIDHAVVTGIEYLRETSENFLRTLTTADPNTDLFHPNSGDPPAGSLQRTGAVNKADSTSAALYAFDTLKLGEKWQVTGGLRWDRFDVDFKSVDANGVTTPLGRTDRILSYRTGVVYKPAPNGSLYAAYGTSANPAAEGLSLSSSATAQNNVNTKPEKNRTYEIGTKWDLFKRRLAVGVALFRTEKTNARTEDPTNPADVIVLQGKHRVDGLEVGAAGSITDEWKLFGGYTLMNSEIVSSKDVRQVGLELSNTPKRSFSLWTTYRLPWDLNVGAGAQFVDDRFSSNNPDSRRTAPSYWLFDAMAAFDVTNNLILRLNAYNLANEKYIQSVGGGHFIPGAGRSAIVTANMKF